MASNKFLFIISGFVSLSIFFFILLLSLYLVMSVNKNKVFALKKDNYISISIDVPIVETKKKKIVKSAPEILPVPAKIETANEPEVDIDNLFDNVWAKKIDTKVKKKKKVNNRRIEEIQKKIKTKTASSKTTKPSEINQQTKDIPVKSISTANEVNEYLAKIQAIVYQYFYPPENSQGNSVKAVIKINSLGKMIDFRILNYSANEYLNKECDKIKSRLISVVFPISPNNKSESYIVILKSEE